MYTLIDMESAILSYNASVCVISSFIYVVCLFYFLFTNLGTVLSKSQAAIDY